MEKAHQLWVVTRSQARRATHVKLKLLNNFNQQQFVSFRTPPYQLGVKACGHY